MLTQQVFIEHLLCAKPCYKQFSPCFHGAYSSVGESLQ